MLEALDPAVRTWIDNLSSALIDAIEVLRPPHVFYVRCAGDGSWTIWPESLVSGVQTEGTPSHSDGERPLEVGRVMATGTGPTIIPAGIRSALKGADVRVEVPEGWVLRRSLEPVPAKTKTYIDAFVRHQIERVLPWRAGEAYYVTSIGPAIDEPDKIVVQISAIARDLVGEIISALSMAEPRRITLNGPAVLEKPSVAIVVPLTSGVDIRRARLQTWVGRFVSLFIALTVLGLGLASWYQVALDRQLSDLDQDIAQRRAFLAAADARKGKSNSPVSGPQALRAKTIPLVSLIETLSAALPDYAYLTELHFESGHIRISGVSRDVAGLIPMIERSGQFGEASFFAPTTRVPRQSGDHFSIEMQVQPSHIQPGEAGTP